MRNAMNGLITAFLGASVAIWYVNSAPNDHLRAQESENRRGSANSIKQTSLEKSTGQPQLPNVYNQEGLSPDEAVNVAVYERVNKSVVNITTRGGDAFLLVEVTTEGNGSGSVIDKNGHILTNYHVVENAKRIEVNLFNSKSYEAKLIGANPVNDVAVIKIDAPPEELYPVAFADSNNLKVGMRVFAIGNPFGLERTMTTGIISSLNRTLQIRANRSIKSIIQIDAAVNPGNSGGPLLDSHGRIIGINTAIASKNGQSAGIGFAIPINLAMRIAPQLIQNGKFVRPEIGIQRVFETEKGLMIASITPGGPAHRAGLKGPKIVRSRRGPFVAERVDRSAADIIVGIDKVKIKTADDFLGYIESKRVGDDILLEIIRDSQVKYISVTLGESQAASREN